MENRRRSLGLIVAILGAMSVVVSVLVVVTTPSGIPFARSLALLAMALALVVTALGVAHHVAEQKQSGGVTIRSVQRWASLSGGVLAAVLVMAMVPVARDFAMPLGDQAQVVVQVVLVLAAGSMAVIGIWGFAHNRTGAER